MVRVVDHRGREWPSLAAYFEYERKKSPYGQAVEQISLDLHEKQKREDRQKRIDEKRD